MTTSNYDQQQRQIDLDRNGHREGGWMISSQGGQGLASMMTPAQEEDLRMNIELERARRRANHGHSVEL